MLDIINKIVFVLILMSCETSDLKYFSGKWEGKGYYCFEEENITNNVNVIVNNEVCYAIKETGNRCMEKGDTSWVYDMTSKETRIKGKFDGEYIYYPAEIKVYGKNSFDIIVFDGTTLNFTRISNQQNME